MSGDSLNETNFRETAQRAIVAYDKKHMIFDSLLWSSIISYYDRALDKLTAELASARKKLDNG